jgi:hypothetical protein
LVLIQSKEKIMTRLILKTKPVKYKLIKIK